jgi:hypothetical protein
LLLCGAIVGVGCVSTDPSVEGPSEIALEGVSAAPLATGVGARSTTTVSGTVTGRTASRYFGFDPERREWLFEVKGLQVERGDGRQVATVTLRGQYDRERLHGCKSEAQVGALPIGAVAASDPSTSRRTSARSFSSALDSSSEPTLEWDAAGIAPGRGEGGSTVSVRSTEAALEAGHVYLRFGETCYSLDEASMHELAWLCRRIRRTWFREREAR